jgi:hypothetical protein
MVRDLDGPREGDSPCAAAVELESRVEVIERAVERLPAMEETLEEIKALMLRVQGAGLFVRLVFWVGAPGIAALYWFREHFKW